MKDSLKKMRGQKDWLGRILVRLPEDFLYRLALAWLIAALGLNLANPYRFTVNLFYQGVSWGWMAVLVLAIWLFLCTIRSKELLVYGMVGLSLLYCLATVTQEASVYYAFGCCVFFAAVVYFSPLKEIKIGLGSRGMWCFGLAAMVASTVWMGGICCLYFLNHATPSFDFGLFIQMFYYMKKSGLPLTTCERHRLLSHFAVHVSPVFYLLLPVYALLPSALTLQVCQCLVVASGVIPLFLLCRHYRISHTVSALFAVILVTYAAFVGGCFFYLHENNFLVPLVLWMFTVFEKGEKRRRGRFLAMVVSTVLVLSVKEDAAVYAAAISAYYLLRRYDLLQNEEDEGKAKRFRLPVWLKSGEFWCFVISVVYFILVVEFLSRYGDGAMTGRYGNFMLDGSGNLSAMLKVIWENPVYVIEECFTQDKLLHFFLLMAPLGFLPLLAVRGEDLILLSAFVLINLMPDYTPQHVVGYQYYFGSGAILIFLTVVHYARLAGMEKKQELRPLANKLVLAAAGASLILTVGRYQAGLFSYWDRYQESSADRMAINAVLEQVPQEADVLCGTFYLPSLAERDEIYDMAYTMKDSTYVVLDLRTRDGLPRIGNGNDWHEKYRKDTRYELIAYEPGLISLFRKRENT